MSDEEDQTERAKRWWDELESSFADYAKWRTDTWPEMIRRRATVPVPPELQQYVAKTGIQGPTLEWALGEYVKIDTLNPTKIDAQCLEEGVRAEKDVEEVRIYCAAEYMRDNRDGQLSHARFEAMNASGLAIERVTYRMHEEPDAPKREDGEEDDAYNERSNKARDDYFMGLDESCFKTVPVKVENCRWDPLYEPTRVMERTKIPISEWHTLTNSEGKYATLDEAGKVVFLGQGQSNEEAGGTSLRDKFLVYNRCEWKEPGTGVWRFYEWCEADGNSDKAERHPLQSGIIPGKRSSYFITPAGDVRYTESDPHLMYRPRMNRLYVLVDLKSQWDTYLAGVIQMVTDLGLVAITLPSGPGMTEYFSFLEEQGLIEGQGAQRRLLIRRPERGSGEWMIVPQLAPLPIQIPDSLAMVIERLDREVMEAQPNRFLTGQAFQETKEGTGSAIIDQRQAAALPFGADLRHSDNTDRDVLYFKLECLRTWDEGVPAGKQKSYRIVTTGNEPDSRGEPDPAREVVITAEKLNRRFTLSAFTKGITQAEKIQEHQAAWLERTWGTLTTRQLLERLDWADPHKQEKELDKEHVRELIAGPQDMIDQKLVLTLASGLVGINLDMMMAGGLAQPTPTGQQNGNGVKPQAPQLARPMIAPPPVGGAQGGSGPGMAGQM